MSVERRVSYQEGDAGLWRMTCAECPLIPHAEALGQKPPDCAAGIATNMQGPVQLNGCPQLVPDSFGNKDGGITIQCKATGGQP